MARTVAMALRRTPVSDILSFSRSRYVVRNEARELRTLEE